MSGRRRAGLVLAAASLCAACTLGVPSAATAAPSTIAYRGLATWVDVFDTRVFDHPEDSVRAMSAVGVRTVFVQTSNSSRTYAIHRPAAMRRLIRAAHARKMRVVAWYLPTLRSPTLDYGRVRAALRFRTHDGQRFDSFALDIESDAVKPSSERNRRLISLSRSLRRLAGPGYPLGAIIPSPYGMNMNRRYWRAFPYRELAAAYDVFVPMGYYSYHGDGAALAYFDATANVRILRAQPGCAREPIHLIGGLASRSSSSEVRAFVRGAKSTGCIGVSLYDWTTTSATLWPYLRGFTSP